MSEFTIVEEDKLDASCYPTEIFLDEAVTKKICPIGYGVYNKAVLDKYGYSYCESCIHRWLDTKLDCPLNKQFLHKGELFINRGLRDEIDEARVICLQSKRGCSWNGKLKDLKSHINSDCLYIKVQCPSCIKGFARKDIEVHYNNCPERVVQCQFCSLPTKKPDMLVNFLMKYPK